MLNYRGSGRELYSPRAGLCALGMKLQQLQLFEVIQRRVKIAQKTIYYHPLEKLQDAFISLLAGAAGLCEINTRLRSDKALQRAFGRQGCAEQSVVQDTLNACTQQNVDEMAAAIIEILRRYSGAYRHDYHNTHLLLDIDITGLPCGPLAELSLKGYFNGEIRYGRQIGRVVAAQYEEIILDWLYAGNVQLNTNLRDVIARMEMVLGLDEEKRRRTVLRVDAGGGSYDDINWRLGRGYQLHCKELSVHRTARLSHTVQRWVADTKVAGRELGWVEPDRSIWHIITPYCRPVRYLAMRQTKSDGSISYSSMLITTQKPLEVISLMQLSVHTLKDEAAVMRAYSHFYDQRAGTIEIANKQSKQGIGLTKRTKKRFAAQQMVMLLASLAHNVLIWARDWLANVSPRFIQYGILRLVRDVLATPGIVKLERNFVVGITLDDTNRATDDLVKALRAILPSPIDVDVGLR